MALFIQNIQKLAIFKRMSSVKSYISTSLQNSALKKYTLELDDIKYGRMNNDENFGIKITTLS